VAPTPSATVPPDQFDGTDHRPPVVVLIQTPPVPAADRHSRMLRPRKTRVELKTSRGNAASRAGLANFERMPRGRLKHGWIWRRLERSWLIDDVLQSSEWVRGCGLAVA